MTTTSVSGTPVAPSLTTMRKIALSLSLAVTFLSGCSSSAGGNAGVGGGSGNAGGGHVGGGAGGGAPGSAASGDSVAGSSGGSGGAAGAAGATAGAGGGGASGGSAGGRGGTGNEGATAGSADAGATAGRGGAGGCDLVATSPVFGCSATYSAELQAACVVGAAARVISAVSCDAFQEVTTSTGYYSVKCAYDVQGQLLWAERCDDSQVICGTGVNGSCRRSIGAPASPPPCTNPKDANCPNYIGGHSGHGGLGGAGGTGGTLGTTTGGTAGQARADSGV